MFGIYIHWPFCASKCPYCDFNSHVSETIDHDDWRKAYKKEIAHYADLTEGREVTSVFVGGGTPSLMEPKTVETILQDISRHWSVSSDIEITLEANPTSVEADKFEAFRDAGINRVSLGVQSLKDDDLKFLGRQHSAGEALKAVEIARDTFDRYSFDLMYARPDQAVSDWRTELSEALQYADGHLSLYQLTIEKGTAFYTMHERQDFMMPDQDCSGEFYEVTQEILEEAGLPAYEISNHARAGEQSIHNLTYWRYRDYLGMGPGAHGRLTLNGQKYATRAHRAPDEWLKRVDDFGHGAHPYDEISDEQQFQEAMMMGLRLREGVNTETFANRLDAKKIDELTGEGLVILKEKTLQPTLAGMQRLNGILSYLL